MRQLLPSQCHWDHLALRVLVRLEILPDLERAERIQAALRRATRHPHGTPDWRGVADTAPELGQQGQGVLSPIRSVAVHGVGVGATSRSGWPLPVTPSVRDAHDDDVAALLHGLSQADRAELEAFSWRDPGELLVESYRRSQRVYTGLLDDEVACMFGVAAPSPFSEQGTPWLLSTEQLRTHWVTLARFSRPYANELLNMHPRLENWVHHDNRTAQRWLRWLGFPLASTPEPVGVKGGRYFRFWRG